MFVSLSGFLFEEPDDAGGKRQAISFDEFCQLASDCGYEGVELRRTQIHPGAGPAERRKVLHAVRAQGLRITCLTARGMPERGPERDAFFEQYLELCGDLEAPLLKVMSDPAWLRSAATRAEEAGVLLAANNHINGALETLEGTRQFFSAVAHPNMRLLYDPMHLFVAGEDYKRGAEEFSPVIANVLVHSVRPASDGENALFAYGGARYTPALPDHPAVQDWPCIFTRLRSCGYDGPVTVIESGWPAERREEVARRCAGFVHSAWKNAAPAE